VRDVTDEQQYAGMLRHTNQELRKQAALLEEINQQLRDATAAKDRFLAVMSHELRTPLNAVIGYADLLELQIKGDLNPAQQQMVRRVLETARHLLALIDEVLDLAKVGAGRVDLKPEPIDLDELLGAALDQISPLANAKGLTLTHSHTGRDPVTAVADRTRLTQVILNLLSNAVKFTERGGVSVAARRNGGGTVELAVRDTGRGIRRDLHERIFEEFYQVDDGLTRSAGGTGLGLAIARRYARLMGGDLTVESAPGEGSEFTVALPAS
jgi:signal transduction histidine kinase